MKILHVIHNYHPAKGGPRQAEVINRARACDCHIANTNFERENLIHKYVVNPAKIITIGIGIEPAQYYCSSEFEINNTDALAEKMEMLIQNTHLCRQMGEAGFSKIKVKYNWPTIVDQYRDAYKIGIENFNQNRRVKTGLKKII